MSKQPESVSKASANSGFQLAGLLLWRFGLLLASSVAVYRVARYALRFVELPRQLEIGIGLIIAGGTLLMGTLVAERIVDSRSEGDLSQ